jgi:hypothetical protein
MSHQPKTFQYQIIRRQNIKRTLRRKSNVETSGRSRRLIAKANSTRKQTLKRKSKVTAITIRPKTSFASVGIPSLRSASGNMLTEAKEVFDVMMLSSEERNSMKPEQAKKPPSLLQFYSIPSSRH